MGRKCTVYGCRGNFDKQSRCTVYKFPTDAKERKQWIDALPNGLTEFQISEHIGVCQYHWPPDTPMIKKNRFCVPAVPPSIWTQEANPNQKKEIPKSCWRRSTQTERPSRNSQAQRNMDIDEGPIFQERDLFKNSESFSTDFEEKIKTLLTDKPTASVAWTIDRRKCIVFSDKRCGNIHNFSVYFDIDCLCKKLTYEGYKGLKKETPGYPVPDSTLTKWSQLESLLEYFQRKQSKGKFYQSDIMYL